MSGVYGQPKREHWELDYLRTVCAAEGCETRLQMLRRSHCRKCGKLFCPKCVGEGLQRRLNVDADFAERGVFCAVCFECYTQNNGWFSERGSAAWIEASSGNVRDWTEELVRERRSCQAETRRKERLDKNAPFSSTWKAAIALKLAKDLLDVRSRAPPLFRPGSLLAFAPSTPTVDCWGASRRGADATMSHTARFPWLHPAV